PVVALGASRDGIDFNAADGAPARLVFLILTPWDDQEAQIGILAEISNIFLDAGVRERCSRAAGYNELVTALKMAYHAREQKD
ncbi:MAG TPA: PTS sugar transporter subunit IIA, partial [Spirochaetota bacterium]|nr:PTS sugar transporter subunit IIA [Spirochaetota bacterium]